MIASHAALLEQDCSQSLMVAGVFRFRFCDSRFHRLVKASEVCKLAENGIYASIQLCI
jgi:hypothetical protein